MLPFGSSLSISIRMLEEPTMWWFAALLFLLGFSTLDTIVKSTGSPAHRRPHPRRPSSKQ